MLILNAVVQDGRIVPQSDVSLPEGTIVTVVVPEAVTQSFEVTPEDEQDLLEAIAACERGETINAAVLLERLRHQ